jgi:hypothetical protein
MNTSYEIPHFVIFPADFNRIVICY